MTRYSERDIWEHFTEGGDVSRIPEMIEDWPQDKRVALADKMARKAMELNPKIVIRYKGEDEPGI